MELLHIINETITITQQKKLLVLATPTTVKSKIYESPSIATAYPSKEDQQEVSRIIDRILEGKVLFADETKIKEIAKKATTTDGIVLGCTELSVLFENDHQFIDPLKIIAEEAVKRAYHATY